MKERELSFIDQCICGIDRALRSLTQNTQPSGRSSPADEHPEQELDEAARKHSAGLMRVNHSGEVCAQALYQGQALTARLDAVREDMNHAADEEIDHLAWCEDRLTALNSRPSILNPAWYGLSFSIGAVAGLIGDSTSLGFVAATENQVCKHLQSHLGQLPEKDRKSRAVVEQMLEDEARHAEMAINAGGKTFSSTVQAGMALVSKAMTFTSYRL